MVEDCSNKGQFLICFRWIDKGFDTHEKFIGIYIVYNIKADILVTVTKDVFIMLKHPIIKCCGQCYDGAKTICGIKKDVSNKDLSKNSKAFFTHCFGYTVNLAVGDMVKSIRFLKDSMDATCEISRLIKKSSERDAMPQKS